jgi:uncharacterized SAM-binding protein YcdF (DUF218 family)
VTSNYLLWLLIKPSHWIAYAAVLGVLLWPLSIARRARGTAAILAVIFGVLPSAWFLLTPLEQRFPVPANPGRVDGIVVLAGAERPSLSELYAQPLLNDDADRLTTFLMLARRFPDARLVHSGDTVPASQSAVAKALLLGAGLDSSRIVFEIRSRSTCGSAAATRELVHAAPTERWLLVTSAYHMPRAVACFRAAGWNITPYPTGFRRGPDPLSFDFLGNLKDLDDAAHEWAGLVYYRLRGLTGELFPRPGPSTAP